jgi:hypothetical protein
MKWAFDIEHDGIWGQLFSLNHRNVPLDNVYVSWSMGKLNPKTGVSTIPQIGGHNLIIGEEWGTTV